MATDKSSASEARAAIHAWEQAAAHHREALAAWHEARLSYLIINAALTPPPGSSVGEQAEADNIRLAAVRQARDAATSRLQDAALHQEEAFEAAGVASDHAGYLAAVELARQYRDPVD